MKRTTTKRIKEYDVAKGIGILLVVIGHALPTDSYWRVFIYSFHMPLFFFLSGLVMKDATLITIKESFLEEKKLIASYLFWSALYLAFDVFVKFLILKTISVNILFWHIYQTVTLFGISVLWFLASLILGKVITKCIAIIFKTDEARLLVAIVIFTISSIAAYFMPQIESGAMRLVYYPIATIIRTVLMSSFIIFGYSVRNNIPLLIEKVKILSGGGGTAQSRLHCYCF
ncbi:MAG: acyltransferase family protein [Lachnospiraceae bacterium]|nr:acyltransferase family protein [Lachnospiraceae bacterium]